jgi:hypothetical protein
MPSGKDIYFKKSVIGLEKRFYVQRRLAAPVPNARELIIDGDFSGAGSWTAGAGITINTAQKRALFAFVNDAALTQSVEEASKSTWYRVEFDVLEYQQGGLAVKMGDEGTEISVAASAGHKSIDVRSKGDNRLFLIGKNSFSGTVSNVSLKKLVFYEDNWFDITAFAGKDAIQSVSRSLDYKSWELGEVKQDNASLKFINAHGELSDEENEESIFHGGFARHYSKIRIDICFDGETQDTLFTGLLDDRSATSAVEKNLAVKESVSAYSFTKLLSDITLNELGALQGKNINDIVFEIMNRGFFTDFFEVRREDIQAGYNAAIDIAQYQDNAKALELLKDLAKGHSAFYIDIDGRFKFRPVEPTPDIKAHFGVTPERKIKVYDYRTGSERVIEKFYWEDSGEKYEAAASRYNTSETIDIKGVQNSADRQAILNHLGAKYSDKKASFKIDLPLCPFIALLDRVSVEQNGATDNSFILDISRLDVGVLELPVVAARITPNANFIVFEVKHSGAKTTLMLLEI